MFPSSAFLHHFLHARLSDSNKQKYARDPGHVEQYKRMNLEQISLCWNGTCVLLSFYSILLAVGLEALVDPFFVCFFHILFRIFNVTSVDYPK